MKRYCLIAVVFLAWIAQSCTTLHPSRLEYEPLVYDPPRPQDHRVELPGGMIVYIKEDHLLPTLDVKALIRTGSVYDPEGKAGLAAMTGAVMRTGGTRTMTGDDLDERLEFMGGILSTTLRRTAGNASLSVLMKDADEGLKLFAGVLMNPVFSEDKINLYKDQAIEKVKNRNDRPRNVLRREFNALLYGEHPLVREESKRSIEGLTRKDLQKFHARYFVPGNVILSVAGDFDRDEMLEKIRKAFAGWKENKVEFPAVPAVEERSRPGVFMVQKKTHQGYVNVGHFGIKETDPDIFAVRIMNFILGGGSFTSRITTKVRSDEGLAYNTGCRFTPQVRFPGTFFGYVQTRCATVHYAVSLILEEFRRIREEPASDPEMETARDHFLNSFPNKFYTTSAAMDALARLEYDGFPRDYFDTYRDRIRSVTKEDVQRVAQKYVRPDDMTLLVVGDIEPCRAGCEKHPGSLEALGKVTILELEDPMAEE